MQLLQREYLNSRLQHYFNEQKLPQTRKRLTHQALIDAIKAKGAIQETEAAEEDNIFRWPFSLNDDENVSNSPTTIKILTMYEFQEIMKQHILHGKY